MSGLLFGISVLNFVRIDFYAVILSLAYLFLGSISSLGNRYFEITGQSDAAKAILKMFVESPSVFFLILGIFYVLSGDLHWIFIGVALFLTFIVFTIAFFDWMQAKEIVKLKNENDSL